MMEMAAYGRLGGDPKSIETSSGKTMAVASLAVEVPERGVDDPEPEWIGVVAFGKQVEALAKHAKGECVSVSRRVQRNRWTDRKGNERQQFQAIVDAVVSARTVRSGGGTLTRPTAPTTAELLSPRPLLRIDDEIPFQRRRARDGGCPCTRPLPGTGDGPTTTAEWRNRLLRRSRRRCVAGWVRRNDWPRSRNGLLRNRP